MIYTYMKWFHNISCTVGVSHPPGASWISRAKHYKTTKLRTTFQKSTMPTSTNPLPGVECVRVFIITSGTLNYASAGPVEELRTTNNNPRRGGDTTWTHNNSNETIYPPTYSSTAERSTTTVTPTKWSTHPCITAVQQTTYIYSSSSRGRERAVKPPWVQNTKVRNTSNTQSHEHTRPSTYTDPPTDPSHPPTDRITYRRTNLPPTIWYSNRAEYSSSSR